MENVLAKRVKGELVIGDHDSISMLGSEFQSALNECSKSISNVMMSSNFEVDYLIDDALKELEIFQKGKEKPWILGSETHYKNVVKKYNNVSKYIDKVIVALKLQQAQIIKDNEILKHIYVKVDSCIDDLEGCIAKGNEALNIANSKLDDNKLTDLESWKNRLSNKLENLAISKTVSMQNKAQIQLLLENNIVLLDKINTVITEIIPLWQNQINILLGIEKRNKSVEKYNEVARTAQDYLGQGLKDINRVTHKKRKEIDISRIENINDKLIGTLGELKVIETEDLNIKKSTVNV